MNHRRDTSYGIGLFAFLVLMFFPILLARDSTTASNQRNSPVPRRELSGDWGGHRDQWLEQGLQLHLYVVHNLGLLKTESERTKARQSASLDLIIRADLQKMGWLRGGELLLLAKSNAGKNINPLLGALSDPIDDADFTAPIYIDQFWYQQSFSRGRVQFRLGFLDQQSSLDRNNLANSEDKQFLSTFLDNNNATIPLAIGLGAMVFVRPLPWWDLSAGIADGDNRLRLAGFNTAFDGLDSLTIYFENGLRKTWKLGQESMVGNYRFGCFYDPNSRDIVSSGQQHDGDLGFYISLDQQVWRGSGENEVGVFFRFGYRDPRHHKIQSFWSGGLALGGPLPGRRRDSLGLAFYTAHVSRLFMEPRDIGLSQETGLELYYKFELTPWLAVTPDVQLVNQPGGRPDQAWVFGLRSRVSF